MPTTGAAHQSRRWGGRHAIASRRQPAMRSTLINTVYWRAARESKAGGAEMAQGRKNADRAEGADEQCTRRRKETRNNAARGPSRRGEGRGERARNEALGREKDGTNTSLKRPREGVSCILCMSHDCAALRRDESGPRRGEASARYDTHRRRVRAIRFASIVFASLSAPADCTAAAAAAAASRTRCASDTRTTCARRGQCTSAMPHREDSSRGATVRRVLTACAAARAA